MKSKLDPSTTPAQKMKRFETALGRILTVSKDELNKRMAEDETIRRHTRVNLALSLLRLRATRGPVRPEGCFTTRLASEFGKRDALSRYLR